MKHARLRLAALLAVPLIAGIFLIWLPALNGLPPDELKMTVIDVGQGDSILLQLPSGRTMLIDGGGAAEGEEAGPDDDVGDRIVVPFLRHAGVRKLDLLVITHPHSDHVGGLNAVLHAFPVGRVLDGDVIPFNTPTYEAVLATERSRRIPCTAARRGLTIDMGDGVSLACLNPPVYGVPYGTDPSNSVINNYSAVMRLTYGRVHILLDGDAQSEAEESMLAAYPGQLSADVLKCGHHGSENATTDPWLDAVKPRYALISCGINNRYGHPSAATLARLAAHHVKTFVTADNGAITVTTNGATVNVSAEHPDAPLRPGVRPGDL